MSNALQLKLKKILEEGLRDGIADLETLPNGHVCGHVASTEFDGCDFEDSRKRIRVLLDRAKAEGRLTADELLKVSTLLTYTRDEWSVAGTNPNAATTQ